MMGHTKISTTQIYADVDEEKIINDMWGLEDKLAKKREIVLTSSKMKEALDKKDGQISRKSFGSARTKL